MQTKVFSKDAVLVLVASFFYMSCPMIVTPIITGFTGMLGGTGFVMGVIGGLVNLVSLGCRPVAGNLADKMDEYHLALAGSGLMLIGCIGYCVAPSILILVLARVINGIGYACCSVSMSTWLSILLPKDKIGSGMGLYGTVQALGMAVAPAFGIKIQSMFGYRAVFAVAVLFALVTILVTLLIRNHGIEDHSGEEPRRKGLQIIDGKVVPIALIVMLFTIPYLATQSFLISYVEKKGIAVDTALFFPLYAVVLVALRSGFRNYFDKVPYRRFLFISMVSSVLALLSLNFMTSDLLMIAAAVFMAGGYGIMCSVSQAGAILLAGPGRRGIANSTYYVGIDLGAALGAIIGGILYGSVDINLFYVVLLLCPVLCFVTYLVFRKELRAV
nr:MFS transporter [uncultured Agathobaculum sp.]